MASELNVLAHLLNRIGESNRRSRDFTLESLRDVIAEVVACFPVYRTYVDGQGWTAEDRAVVERAITQARRRNPAMEASLFDFFREVMLPREPDEGGRASEGIGATAILPADAAEARERLSFAMKLQQYTGPVQAKGLEDTSFYRYNLLLSLNEVGGDPSRFGRSVEEFHEAQRPAAARLAVRDDRDRQRTTRSSAKTCARASTCCRRCPTSGRATPRDWMRINRRHRTIVDGEPAPDRNDEYRFYQALVGVWPPDASRAASPSVGELVERHAGVHDQVGQGGQAAHQLADAATRQYEEAVTRFVERALAGPGREVPLGVRPLRRRLALAGAVNSLSQVALKMASPGIPDVYQGTELWDLQPGRSRQPQAGRLRTPASTARGDRCHPVARPGRARRGDRGAAGGLGRRGDQAAGDDGLPSPAPRAAGPLSRRRVHPARRGVDRRRLTRRLRAAPRRSRGRRRGAPFLLVHDRPGHADADRRRRMANVANPAAGVPERAHFPGRRQRSERPAGGDRQGVVAFRGSTLLFPASGSAPRRAG